MSSRDSRRLAEILVDRLVNLGPTRSEKIESVLRYLNDLDNHQPEQSIIRSPEDLRQIVYSLVAQFFVDFKEPDASTSKHAQGQHDMYNALSEYVLGEMAPYQPEPNDTKAEKSIIPDSIEKLSITTPESVAEAPPKRDQSLDEIVEDAIREMEELASIEWNEHIDLNELHDIVRIACREYAAKQWELLGDIEKAILQVDASDVGVLSDLANVKDAKFTWDFDEQQAEPHNRNWRDSLMSLHKKLNNLTALLARIKEK